MEHDEYNVQLCNEHGITTGYKVRRDVDKKRDTIHVVDIFVIGGGKLLLAKIPTSPIYTGLWGVSAVTLLRQHESVEEGALRCLESELEIIPTDVMLDPLGAKFFQYPDGVRRFRTTFYAETLRKVFVTDPKNASELRWFSRDDIDDMVDNAAIECSPPFLALWREYREKIPMR